MGARSESDHRIEIEQRLLFETLLVDVCAQFVNVAPSDIDSKIANAQRVICESLKVDHSSVWQVSEENPEMPVMTHVYRDPNLKPLPLHPSIKEYFPWSSSKILNKEIVCVPNTATLPPEAATDKESWEEYGIHSSLVIPLSVGGGPLIGVLAFDNMENRNWPEPLQRRLQILAYVFAQALDRKNAEWKVRESEHRFRLVADTAPVLMWMSGTDKLCTYFNKPWLDFTGRSMEEEFGNGWAEGVHPEDLQRCLQTYAQSFDRRENFRMEYRLRRYDGEYRWVLDIGVPRFNQDRSFAGYIGIGVDVTERKRAEESRIRTAAIVESSDDAIAALDMNGTITDWNKGAERLFGYSASEAIGENILFLSLPDARDDVKGVLKKVWQGEVMRHHEAVRQRKDGTSVEISLTISPIVDSEGRIVGASGIAHDITERKRAERELATVSERLQLAIESGSVGGWDYNLKTGKKVWFGETHAQLGMAPDEAPGSFEESWDRIHKDDREHLQHALRVAREKHQQFTEEFRVVWRDGTTRWVRSRGRFFYAANGEPERLLGLSVDVTDRKRAEDALRVSEERLRLAQWAARIGTFELNVKTWTSIWTSELEAIYGLPPGGFGGTQTAFENLIHPDDRAGAMKLVDEALKTGQPTQGEWRVVWPDGSVHWIAGRAQVFMNESGEPLRMLGVNMDITERKQAEEALSSMTRKLVEAQEQERARIARELHDDINQRLALLAVELEQLKGNPSEIESRLQELQKRTTEISNDVQAISHDLHSSQLEYLGAVAGIKSWCKEFAERQGMQIDYRHDVRGTVPPEIGLCLFRVLEEGLHNAAKHSGVKRIEVELTEDSGEIHLIVSDLGRGFDIEAARQGRGLGLTSMRERVRLVNGTIAIESKPMGGTTIHVRVPLESEKLSERAVG